MIKTKKSEKRFVLERNNWYDLKMPITKDENGELKVTIEVLTPLLHVRGRELGIAVERMWLTKE